MDDLVNSVLTKIEKERKKRGWSIYRLADESGINAPTIHYWYKHNAMPSLEFINDICVAFNITLSDFFANNNRVELTPELEALFNCWTVLTKDEQDSIKAIAKSYMAKKR